MQHMLSFVRRAVDDFKMISDGDKICIGLSGGKDSTTLLVVLNALRSFYPNKFDLCAATIDMGFDGADFSPLSDLCSRLNVEYIIKPTHIAQIVFDLRKEPNPCSLCAKMRRGALNKQAREMGCNKVALGHHRDDAIETMFLSLFFEGRISCFSPVTYLDRTEITQIRPLIYLEEKDIRSFVKKNMVPVVINPCPSNGNTKRQYVKELISDLDRQNHGLKQRVFGAITRMADWKTEK